jgi:ATP-dependent Clp protease adaptor protein ClpS
MSDESENFESDESSDGVAVQEGLPKLKHPPRYSVILHNDDYTTMEFVMEVLKRFFRKTEEEAFQVMMRVHQQGKGIAGVYDKEIAETKVEQVHTAAKTKGHPLQCSMEPAPQ